MASISRTNVFEGIWTNWTYGKLQGLTWTLSTTNGTLLTSSLALFVTLAGSQLWIIIRFAIHQLRASHSSADTQERRLQERVVLRNAATDLNTVLLMTQLIWTFRNTRDRSCSFPMLIICLAIVHYLLFLSAGAFSNRLVGAGPAVLLRSPYCGVWNETYYDYINDAGMDTSSMQGVSTYLQYEDKMQLNVLLSLDYARECYQHDENSIGPSACDTLPVSVLHVNQTSYAGSCPFEPQMCHGGSETVRFDTGVIDSHLHLGINAPRHDRLTYRRLTTCAVLNNTGYVLDTRESANGTSGTPAHSTASAYFGPSLLQLTNFTYAYSDLGSVATDFLAQSTDPYLLNTQIAYGASRLPPEYSEFEPIPQIRQNSADLILLFMSYNGRYFVPVNDPWFSAHVQHEENTRAAIARIQFAPDNLVNTLGCTEQHQFCNTKNDSCTPLLGWGQVQDAVSFRAGLSPFQSVTFDRMIRAADASSIAQITSALAWARPPLLASAQAAIQSKAMSLHLPDDQWQLELHNWYTIALAQFQRTIMQWGTGDIAPDPQSQLVRPETKADSWFCDNIMIPSARHQSFSLLRLILIGIAGTMVIIISWNIEDLTTWLRVRCRKGLALKQIWDEDDMLRLKCNTPVSSREPQPSSRDSCDPDPQPSQSEKRELAVTETEIGTSLWSEPPSQPPRNSCVPLSLNGKEKGESPGSVHGGLTAKDSVPALKMGHTPKISNHRAHALARIYDTWIQTPWVHDVVLLCSWMGSSNPCARPQASDSGTLPKREA